MSEWREETLLILQPGERIADVVWSCECGCPAIGIDDPPDPPFSCECPECGETFAILEHIPKVGV